MALAVVGRQNGRGAVVGMVVVEDGGAFTALSSSSDERSEIGGPSGAEGDLYCKRGAWEFRPDGRRWVPRSAPLRVT